MIPRRLVLLAVAVLAVPAATAYAQTAPAGAVSPQQAQQALSVLRDAGKRNEMISILETIAKMAPAGPANPPPAANTASGAPAPVITGAGAPAGNVPSLGTAAATATPTPDSASAAVPGTAAQAAAAVSASAKLPIPLAPDSLGAELVLGASSRLQRLSASVSETVRTLTNFTLLVRWLTDIADDPTSRAEVFEASWKLLVIAVASLGLEYAATLPLRRPIRSLLGHTFPEQATGGGNSARRRRAAVLTLRRAPLILARLALDLLPILVMGGVAFALATTRLGEPSTTKLVIVTLLNVYLLWRVIVIVSRAVVSPDGAALRVPRLDDAAAAAILRWVRRLAAVALFGYAATEVALVFGLYRVAHDALLKMVALAVHLMLAIIVLQQRAAVAAAIRPAPDQTGVVAGVRARLAPIWHFIVIFYIIALWGVWALDVPGGFQRLLFGFVYTVVIASGARLLAVLLTSSVDHVVGQDDERAARTPGLDNAMRRYLPILHTLINVSFATVGVILMFMAWGIDSLSWFTSGALGGRLVSAITTSVLTILAGLVVWEVSNAAVQNHLATLSRQGHVARSARLRTVLPMLRTTLVVAISLFAGLTVLSEIGVNIAPLLAGASVVGLAIGFGSQKLVQDIITGLFLLLENTMQVGDVVILAGMTGTVENLSVRTIRLRALDGAVHIVPFSAVTTVTNMTRDFAYAMLDVSIGLNEEPDHIADVLCEVADRMREEPRWAAAITDGMEIMGVEKFIDTAWVLRCRLKTVPSQRWTVARELNRRLKYRFDELAIESPFTSYRALAAAAPPPPNAKTVEEA